MKDVYWSIEEYLEALVYGLEFFFAESPNEQVHHEIAHNTVALKRVTRC